MKDPENRVSAWEFVGPVFLEALKGQRPDTINGSQTVAVLVVGICPAALAESIKSDRTIELARVFAGFYDTRPDLTLRLLAVIRKKWNDASFTAKVQKGVLAPYERLAPVSYKTISGAPFRKRGRILNDEVLEFVIDPKQKLKNIGSAVDAVKKARQRIRRPVERPVITRALGEALRELRGGGLDVGIGW